MSAWDNPQEMMTRAQNAQAQGDRDLAYQMYARASELNPQDAQAWRGRAETANNQDEILVSYGYASALDPEDSSLTQTLDDAVAQRVAGAQKNEVPLLLDVGQELAEVGLTDRALQVFARASELDGRSGEALVWMAGLEPDKEKQIAYLNRAAIVNPRDPRVRAGLLTLNPPAPAPPAEATEPVAVPETKAPAASKLSQTSDMSARTESSMERLRKLRESMPTPETTKTPDAEPPPQTKAPPKRGFNTMQILLIVLLLLVILLVAAGIFLMLNP